MAWNHESDCSLVPELQVRSLQLGEVPLTCLATIVAPEAVQGHTPAVLLAGSYDSQVYAYAPGPGRQLGAFAGHSDAVSCLHLWNPNQLLTASWDCSIKVWRWALGVTACCAGVTGFKDRLCWQSHSRGLAGHRTPSFDIVSGCSRPEAEAQDAAHDQQLHGMIICRC